MFHRLRSRPALTGRLATISKRLPKTWMHKWQETAPKAVTSSAALESGTRVLVVPSLGAAGGVGSWVGPNSIRWWAGLEFDGFSDLFDSDP